MYPQLRTRTQKNAVPPNRLPMFAGIPRSLREPRAFAGKRKHAAPPVTFAMIPPAPASAAKHAPLTHGTQLLLVKHACAQEILKNALWEDTVSRRLPQLGTPRR